MNEGESPGEEYIWEKIFLCDVQAIFLSGLVQRMLELSDALVVQVVEQASKNAVNRVTNKFGRI